MQPVLKFTGPAEAKDGVITAVLSTESVDRDGDIVRLSGWRLDGLDGLPLLSCHDYGNILKQIGEWQNIRVDPRRGALIGEPVYYTDCGNPEADYAYQIALKGRARFSVGFLPHEGSPRKGGLGREYTDQELLEVSQVPVPSNRDAVQLAVKTFRERWQAERRRANHPARKWASNYMNDDGDGFAPCDVHCIVAGCDDASQTTVPICSEHLKYLMNSAPEPPGSPPDDDDLVNRGLLLGYRTRIKAGRQISAANMSKLHDALSALHDVHDAACDSDECPLAESAGTARKALNESSGAAGGALVADDDIAISDSGTHGAFNGRHSHPHDAAGHTSSADEDGLHEHMHTHDGEGDHGHAHPEGTNFKTLREREITRAQWTTAFVNDLPDSAFAVISAGGTKDAEGKTVPRSLRYLPHHKPDGSVDLPHLKSMVGKNALSRLPQSDLSAEDRAAAEKHLDAHAKAEKIGDYAEDDGSKGADAPSFPAAFEEAVAKALEAIAW